MNRTFKDVPNDPIKEFEYQKEIIEELLAEIETGLLQYDRNASSQPGGPHWGHVGGLTSIADTLRDLKDRLHGTGEYAKSW